MEYLEKAPVKTLAHTLALVTGKESRHANHYTTHHPYSNEEEEEDKGQQGCYGPFTSVTNGYT